MDKTLLTNTNISARNTAYQSELYGVDRIIGNSSVITHLKNKIKQIARSKANIMILGESGTGKELIARAIHEESDRSKAKFVPVDCSVLTESIIESELFGHIKGAFTGANKDREGLFMVANNGTLFLDEIGNLNSVIQSKLLRFLQEKEIKPVGSSNILKVNVRIISATNIDIEYEINAGNFREDLYYRLSGIELHVPPLSERRDDIPLLVDYFIKKYSFELNKNINGIENDALTTLMLRQWKGNVRELQHVVEHAIIIEENDKIMFDTLNQILPEFRRSSNCSQASKVLNLNFAVEQFEKKHIKYVLELAGNNKTKAANMLGISRSVLYDKLKKYQID